MIHSYIFIVITYVILSHQVLWQSAECQCVNYTDMSVIKFLIASDMNYRKDLKVPRGWYTNVSVARLTQECI